MQSNAGEVAQTDNLPFVSGCYRFIISEVLLRGHLHDLGAVGLEGFLDHVQSLIIHAQCCGRLCIDGHNAVVEGLVRQVGGGLTLAEQLDHHVCGASPSWT